MLFTSDIQGLSGFSFFRLMQSDNYFINRMIGLIRSVSKFPTYRRRFRQVVKALVSYSESRPETSRSDSIRSVFSIENV